MTSTVSVGVGPVSFDEVLAVTRGGAGVTLTTEARTAIEKARAVVEELAGAPTPAYGISTGFGALATRHIPTEMRAQLQRSLVRSHAAGSGPEVEREVTRGLMLLRLSTLATGHTGVRLETAQLLANLLSHGITPVVHEYGSLGCSGDLAPLSHCALALMGEGEVRDAERHPHAGRRRARRGRTRTGRARRQGGPRPDQRDRRHARHAGDGDQRPAAPAQDGRHRGGHVGRGPARHRPGLRRRAPGDPAAPRPGPVGSQPHARARGLRRRRVAPRPRLQPGPGCLLAALLAAGAGSRPRHGGVRRAGRRTRARLGRRQPGGAGRRGSRGVQRELPRRTRRLCPRLPRDRRRRCGVDQRAAYGPVPRQGPQPRAEPVPRRRPGRGQRPHDRAVHPGRDRLGAQTAREPGLGRLDPVERDAGGPRLDGLVRCAEASSFRRRAHPGGRDRGPHGRPCPGDAGTVGALAGHRGRRTTPAEQRDPGTRTRPTPLTRDREPRSSSCAPAPCCASSKTRLENSL